ncbi:TFIIB-type zinc ribbon-containing protein [bacterium]|nr:TFIIB-type zinc ribbon-containing protein [bacterium]MCI6884774.1 TFIIB-type zinc ribbon-containing protein [bacterium]
MAMDLNAKAAYIRGLMNGLDFDPASKNGKIIAAMMDLLEELAAAVTDHDDALDQVYDELDDLDEDLDDLVHGILDLDDAEDEEDGETEYEVTCPNCGAVNIVDEESLMTGELVCPDCGASFDVEILPEEDTPTGEDADPPKPTNIKID